MVRKVFRANPINNSASFMTTPPRGEYLAHARPLADGTFEVHSVAEHLAGVAERAADFAAVFGAAD
ncbi:MAG TPA: hypothetical protein VE913_03370, partial [Longimicrobium sp.]|nr:hypothetical protein [Longimicrobium sp.]